MAEPVPDASAGAQEKKEEAKKEEAKKAEKKFEFDRPRHVRFLKHCLNVLPSPYLSERLGDPISAPLSVPHCFLRTNSLLLHPPFS